MFRLRVRWCAALALVVSLIACSGASAAPTISGLARDASVETANNQVGYTFTANAETTHVKISVLVEESWIEIATVSRGGSWDNDVIRDGEGTPFAFINGASEALLFVPYNGAISGTSDMISVVVGSGGGGGGGGTGPITLVEFVPDAVAGQIKLDISVDGTVYGFDVYADAVYQNSYGYGPPVSPVSTVSTNSINGTHSFTVQCWDENYNDLGTFNIGSYTDNNSPQTGTEGGGGGGGGGSATIANVQRIADVCDQLKVEYFVDADIDYVDWHLVNTSTDTAAADQPDLTFPPGEGTYTSLLLFGAQVYTMPNGSYRLEATPYDGESVAGATVSITFDVSCAVVDTDEDGLPDDWENQHDCVDSAFDDDEADPDGDGATNLQEFEAGTDPCDAQDFPESEQTDPPEVPTLGAYQFPVLPAFEPFIELYISNFPQNQNLDALSNMNLPQLQSDNLELEFFFTSPGLPSFGSVSWTSDVSQNLIAADQLTVIRGTVRSLLSLCVSAFFFFKTWSVILGGSS